MHAACNMTHAVIFVGVNCYVALALASHELHLVASC
jgi:hypothetical protein